MSAPTTGIFIGLHAFAYIFAYHFYFIKAPVKSEHHLTNALSLKFFFFFSASVMAISIGLRLFM